MNDDVENLVKALGPSKIVKKVQGFVERYNKQEFSYRDPDSRLNRIYLMDLAKAVHEFEIAEEIFGDRMYTWDYTSKLEKLNELINEGYTAEIIQDNIKLKDFGECQQRRTELEQELVNSKSLNTKLAEDKIQLEKILRDIFINLPKVLDKYKKDLPRGFFDEDDDFVRE